MNSFLRSVRFELNKISSMKMWWIICLIAIVAQPLLALITARGYLKIGLDATPETQSGLLNSLPPLDYFGFELVPFGLLPMVIFGGIIGGSEYLHHQLRTTLLCQSSRIKVFCAKVLAILVCAIFISIIAIYLTISATHFTLGEQGLHPIFLSSIAWQFIGYSVLDWILLTILSFGLGMLFKNAIVPLAFLVPQIYNLGLYLAQKWEWGIYLPVAAGNLLFATPTDPFEHDPLKGLVVLLLWVIVALSTSYYTFIRSDVGGEILMYAALHSEQTKFFSFGWCILGIFGAVVVPLCYLLTLNVPKTGGEKEILSLCLQALYLGHPGVIVASAAYFGQEYSNSALRTTLLTQPSRLKIACIKFLNNVLIIVITGVVTSVICLFVLYIQHDMKLSSVYELMITGSLSVSILSWIQIALITAALSVITKSLIVPLAIMLPLMLGLSHMFFSISQSAKFLPTLATMNFFSIPESTVFLEKWSGLGVQFIWALLLVISSTFIFSHRNVR